MKTEKIDNIKQLIMQDVRTDGTDVFFNDSSRRVWAPMSGNLATITLRKILDANGESLTAQECREVLKDLASDPAFYRPLKEPAVKLINCKNGVLELPQCQLHDGWANADFRFQLDFVFDDKATPSKCPNFMKFIKFAYDLTDGTSDEDVLKDSAVIRLLEMLGYMVSNEYRAKKLLLIIGPPNSGKSQILELVRRVIGAGNTVPLTLEDLSGKGAGRFRTELIRNKHAVINDELPTKGVRHLSELKKFIAGEFVPIEAKGKQPTMMRNRAKLMFAGNQLPDLAEADCGNAFSSRLCVTAFKKSISTFQRDVGLVDKLYAERNIIFSMAVKAFAAISTSGLCFHTDPEAEALLKAYAEANSTVLTYIKDEAFIVTGAGVHTKELYERYLAYCDTMSLTPAKNFKAFRQELLAIPGMQIMKTRLEGDINPCSVVRGIAFVKRVVKVA